MMNRQFVPSLRFFFAFVRFFFNRSGKRPEVMMNRQFVRDVPSLLRLNGAPPPGDSPEDKVHIFFLEKK
jgi:hypothetical protein